VPAGVSGTVDVTVTPAGVTASNALSCVVAATTGDTTPPATVAGGAEDGQVTSRDVVVSLTDGDEAGGSGVASISPAWDGAPPTTVVGSSTAAVIAASPDHGNDGAHTLVYYATDNAGNVEPPHFLTVTIDTLGPVTRAPYTSRVRRGGTAGLWFTLLDSADQVVAAPATVAPRRALAGPAAARAPRAGAGLVDVTVKIRTLGGRVVKTVRFGWLETGYTSRVRILGNRAGWRGGDVVNLYPSGAERNIDTFHKCITAGTYDNPTLEPSVNATLTTILGREAARRRAKLMLQEVLQENRRLEPDLTGLKA
jgi:hypothetical protein